MNEAELGAGLTAEAEQAESPEINLNPCQGYKADLLTKLHLCSTRSYHRYRNEAKPWVKIIRS